MQMFVARFASRNLSILLEANDIIAGSTKRKVATFRHESRRETWLPLRPLRQGFCSLPGAVDS